MDSIVIVRLLALSQESPLKTSPEQLERSRLDAIARRVAATASTVANAAVGALDRKSQFVSPTKPLQMNGAAAATVALVISPQQRERMAQNEREAKLRLANKRKRDETSPRAAAVADSGGGGNATATTSKARTLIFTSAAAASAGAGVDDSNKRIKPTPPLSATAASSSSSSSSSSAAAAAARANGNGTAAAARAVVRPLPNGICVLRPDTEWLLSSAHAPRSLLSAAGRDSLSTPSGFILMLIFDQLNIWDDSTTTTILTPVLAAKSASAGAAPVIPPRVLHWSTFETCQLVCKSWNITLTQNARFVWKRRALYILRQCEPMNFDRYHRILQCPPPKITQYDPDDYYEVSRKIAACDRLASELVISLAKYELQRMESTKRVGGGVDDMFCARLGQFRWPPSNPISYVNDVLFAPAFDPAVKKLSSSQSKPAAGLFRGVLYTNMRGQNDEKCDEPTQRRIDRFITEYLSVDDSLLATAHAPYVALPSNCGYQRLGACVALSVLNAGQSRRIVRLFRVVQSEFGITRGWLQEVLCLLLCRIHRLWTLTLSMQQPRPEPTEELARLYRIIR